MKLNFIRNISCPLIFRRDGLRDFFTYLAELEKSQYFSRDKIAELQLNRLKKILCHAYNHTEFYRKRFCESGFDPFSLNYIDDLKKIPILSKQDIRKNTTSMRVKSYKDSELHSAETGGTTGIKIKFLRDNACLSPKEAALYRFDKWTGWDFGERMGVVWTAQQDYVGHWTLKSRIKNALSCRQVVFPAAVMDVELISNYVNLLLKKRPTMIRAFVSPLFEVAQYILDQQGEGINLKGIVTTGEPLYGHQRKVVSMAFNCDVFDSYRTREVGPVAQECSAHQGLHINAESVYIEIVEPDAQGQGKIVVTDLLNYGMPFIRYEIGDFGILSNEECLCGRGLPILNKVTGRIANSLYTPEGKIVTAGSLVLYLVDEAPGLLGQVQIIQDAFDHITIKMTKNPPPTMEIFTYQKNTVKRLFGENMQVTFEEVESIPIEKSGKYLFTICKLPNKKL